MRTIFKPVYARLGISALYRKLEKLQDFGGVEEEHKGASVSQSMVGGAVRVDPIDADRARCALLKQTEASP